MWISQGRHPEGPGYRSKLYYEPTGLADCTLEMLVMREETFGPVAGLIPFDTEEEAIEIANDTPYGLTNYVQTQDGDRANRMARALRSWNSVVGTPTPTRVWWAAPWTGCWVSWPKAW